MKQKLLIPDKYKDPIKLLTELKKRPEEYWIQRGEKRVLQLFQEMTKRVPAYKDFLKKNGLNPRSIKTIKDFKEKVPLIDKQNYLRKYPHEKLHWDGKFIHKHWDIAATSGSTGEPFYFPREESQNKQYAATAELYLRTNFEIQKKSTLYINCFALGVWIGGLFTYEAIKSVARRGNYPLTLINPGLNKIEIIKTVRNLGRYYDQVIIAGYPPFVKDVIDDGIQYGVKWKKHNLKFIFSAEGFSEEFRNYIAKKAGLKNIYRDTLNHYGTVDQGTLAYETPLSVLLRRIAVQKPKIFKALFPDSKGHRLPTLCQYDPEMFFFEAVNGGIICSSYSGLPLVRYDLKDSGGILSSWKIEKILEGFGVNLKKEAKRAKIEDTLWHLPFVYVYERKDFSVSVAGANIYPEPIKKALHAKTFHKFITGKCRLESVTDQKQNQHLRIHLEMRNGIKKISPGIKKNILNTILARLLKENSEFKSMFEDQRQGKDMPQIIFWPYENAEHFSGKGKQQWVKK